MLFTAKTVFMALTLAVLISVTTAISIEQLQRGKLDGYWGAASADTPKHGDVVTQTYCYCQKPTAEFTNKAEDWDLGHVFQILYYNKHQNATFALGRTARCHHLDMVSQYERCFLYWSHEGVFRQLENWDGNRDPLQRSWQSIAPFDTGHGGDHRGDGDVLQFVPNTYWSQRGSRQKANWIQFNRQARNLGYLGGQAKGNKGYVTTAQGLTQEICGTTCKDFLEMEVATHNGDIWKEPLPSVQYVNDDVDDMCHGCK